MKFILFFLACFSFLVGAAVMATSKGALHEIEGFVLFLIAAVLIAGAAMVEAVYRAGRRIEEKLESRENARCNPDIAS